MSHYFGVACMGSIDMVSLCDMLNELTFDNECYNLYAMFDYYRFNTEHDTMVLKPDKVGWLVSPMGDKIKISGGKCNCAMAEDIDWENTSMKLPYLCFMPDGCYWKWGKRNELESEEWAEVKQQAIKNGWYITIFDFHI